MSTGYRFTQVEAAPSSRSIERIDNDGDYEPTNCAWATGKEQHRNTRGNIIVTIDGIPGPLSEMCERHNLSYQRVRNLMRKRTAQEAVESCLRVGENEQLCFLKEITP